MSASNDELITYGFKGTCCDKMLLLVPKKYVNSYLMMFFREMKC